jgi:hypothetical protein
LFIGTIYFVLVPLGLLLWQGELYLPPLLAIPGIGNIILRSYDREVLLVLSIVLSALLLGHIYSILFGRQLVNAIERVASYRGLLVVSLVLFVATSMFLFLEEGLTGGGQWYTSRTGVIEDYGSLGLVIAHSSVASKVLVLCIAAAWYRAGKIGFIYLSAMMLPICIFDLYITSNRIYTLQTIILIGCLLVLNREFAKLGLLALLAYPFGVAMNLFAMARPFIHLAGMSFDAIVQGYQFAVAHHVGGGIIGFSMGITEAADFMVLLEILKTFPKAHPFLGGATIAKLLFAIIPRTIWIHKPMNISVAAAELFVGSAQGTSLVTTIYGEFYANFGILAALLIPAAMIVVQRLLRWCVRNLDLALPMGIVYGFTLTRMAFSDTLLTLIITGVLVRGWLMVVNDWREIGSADWAGKTSSTAAI